jgi:hypothetical protein
MYRQYNESGRQHVTDNVMPIYSVGPDTARRRVKDHRLTSQLLSRLPIPVSMSTRWR